MGSRDRPEHRWVLDYHMPAARVEPRGVRSADEPEDDPDQGEDDAPAAAGEVVDQLRDLYGPGAVADRASLAAEVIRHDGQEVIGVDLVLPGETAGPLGAALATVRFELEGRCLLRVAAEDAELAVHHRPGEEAERALATAEVEVPAAGRVVVRRGEGVLLVRLVRRPSVPTPRPWSPARIALAVVVALAVGALVWLGWR